MVVWFALALVLSAHPWPAAKDAETLESRFPPPSGFTRVAAAEGSFGAWLRALPMLKGRPAVMLFDGSAKGNQEAHAAIVDIDVGKKDLQQCADAVIRLFAEYQWASKKEHEVCFKFTSGDPIAWKDWSAGTRPEIRGSKVRMKKTAAANTTYAGFRKYLDLIFTYAGTKSIARDLPSVATTAPIELGDVFVQGGSPGHAVLVVDVASAADGRRAFLLAQSYMPAQQIHVLRNPKSDSSWYLDAPGTLETPEWTFDRADLRRFGETACP